MRHVFAFAIGLFIASGLRANCAEIKVFTARAGATVLEKIGPDFERQTGHKLVVISGFGPAFVQRINAGESFDVLISGAPPIDGLIKNGKINGDTRTNLMRSGLGVEVREGTSKPDISSVEMFKHALINARSIGYLKNVNRVEQLMERLHIADAIKSNVSAQTSDIVSELVAKGEIELGIVVITQILTTPGVTFVGPLPPEIQSYTQFVAGVSASSKAPDAARDLIQFFANPLAIPVIKSQGMEPG
jgi:molybdate transport system substrate-binding protein